MQNRGTDAKMPRDPAARPVTTGYAPLFGAPPPPIHEDRVHVYSKHMQMTLPSFGEAFAIAPPPAAAATQDRGPMPPLSPGPPLRGYAAEPLLPASAATSANFGATTGRSSPVPETKQEAYEREYEEMMRNIRARSATKGEAFAEEEDRRMERLLKHIATEEEWVQSIERKLQMREAQCFARQSELAREWGSKVFRNIQRQIEEQLAARSVEKIRERRLALMEEFIQIEKRKDGGIKLDIIIESEYDPFLGHKSLMKYKMNDLNDPLKQEVNALNMLPNGKLKPKPKMGRDSLDVRLWDRLDATPFGRFDRLLLEHPPEPRTDGEGFSRVNFDHYQVATDRATLDREFPRGKRIDSGVVAQRMSKIFEPQLS